MRIESPALAATALRVAFGTREGLAAIDMTVARGERVALLGPSGSGKTSLLRSLAGLQPLLAGRVEVDGAEVTTLAPERRGIVYMHQAPSLFPHLSVLDNVAFPLEVRGEARESARRAARTWLDRVQLHALAGRAPSTLSGGQRHRVALARALAASPRVLLLDEPFASLDPTLRAEVRDVVLQVLREPTAPAALVVTHDVDEAAALGDRVAILLDGRLAQSGPAASVFARPDSVAVARFLGTTNLMPGRRDGNGQVHCGPGTFPSPGVAGTVHVAVRPGHVRLHRGDGVGAMEDGHVAGAATVEAVMERVSGTFVQVRWHAAPEAGSWLAAVAAGPPHMGDVVTVSFAVTDAHVITESAPEGRDVR